MPRSTQVERRGVTRQRLLAAAAAVIAERGVEHASVDAIADAADLTCGALYDHFGSKHGLLSELLATCTTQVTTATETELATLTLDDQLTVLWHKMVDGPDGGPTQGLRLEHELWRWVSRQGSSDAHQELVARCRRNHAGLAEAVSTWTARGWIAPSLVAATLASMMSGLLMGLEMQYRVDPEAVVVDDVVKALRALIGATTSDWGSARHGG